MPCELAARNYLPSSLEEVRYSEILSRCLFLPTGCSVYGQGSAVWRPVEIEIRRAMLIRVAV